MAINDQYVRLKVALETKVLPDDVIDWLKYGMKQFEAPDNKKPFCVCLGIHGTGKDSIGTEIARQQRDRHLYQAWKLVAINEKIDDWSRSKRLLEYINKFQSTTWPRIQAYTDPPERLDLLQKTLFKIFKTNTPIPSSCKQINRIAMDMK